MSLLQHYYEEKYHSLLNVIVVESIQPVEEKKIGGAGNKCLKVLLGEVDFYIASSLCYWDICAPEVLIKAMGGYCTDFKSVKP